MALRSTRRAWAPFSASCADKLGSVRHALGAERCKTLLERLREAALEYGAFCSQVACGKPAERQASNHAAARVQTRQRTRLWWAVGTRSGACSWLPQRW